MSLLTDFFVAPFDASDGALTGVPAKTFPSAEFNGLSNTTFSELVEVIGLPAEAQLISNDDCIVHQSSDEGPWVFRMPDAAPAALARLKDSDLPGIAERWAAGEETAFSEARGPDLEPIIRQLRELASKAQNTGESLYLWMSL